MALFLNLRSGLMGLDAIVFQKVTITDTYLSVINKQKTRPDDLVRV